MDGPPGDSRRSRSGWVAVAVLSTLAAPAFPAAAAEEHVAFLPTPVGAVLLVLPAETAAARRHPPPVVLALPDAPRPGRGRPYLAVALDAAGPGRLGEPGALSSTGGAASGAGPRPPAPLTEPPSTASGG